MKILRLFVEGYVVEGCDVGGFFEEIKLVCCDEELDSVLDR
jgi:hypothetical protein